MRIYLSVAWIVMSFSVTAGERELSGDEISKLLPTIIANGEDSRQIFTDTGATTYWDNGRKTEGRWRVQNSLYCSQWPPSDAWACYRVMTDSSSAQNSKTITWIGMSGNRTINQINYKGSSQ